MYGEVFVGKSMEVSKYLLILGELLTEIEALEYKFPQSQARRNRSST